MYTANIIDKGFLQTTDNHSGIPSIVYIYTMYNVYKQAANPHAAITEASDCLHCTCIITVLEKVYDMIISFRSVGIGKEYYTDHNA